MILLTYAWKLQTAPIICQGHFGTLKEHNGYIEIELREQHPIEPVFTGKLFFLSVNPKDASITSVVVKRGKEQSYGLSEHRMRTIWDQAVFEGLRPEQPEKDFTIVAHSGGSHRLFPLDSAEFDFDLEIEPAIDIPVVRMGNGFYPDITDG